ncbi:MAG: hypothetical protein P1P80_05015 [ANME-2 cluster archaeon]|nr:hypothetical protein [ANME-2 cluster archaeon]
MKDIVKYFILSVVFWIVVDYSTAFNPNFQDWLNYMPEIWFFYIGYPLIFTYVIYKKRWDTRRIFYAMLIGTFVVEVVLSQNALLYTFPIMLIMIPIAVCIYSFITFVPKWMVENRLTENKKKTIILILVWVMVAFLSYITRINSA